MNTVDIRQVEEVIDEVCVEFANKTLGVSWFQAGHVSIWNLVDQPEKVKTTHAF